MQQKFIHLAKVAWGCGLGKPAGGGIMAVNRWAKWFARRPWSRFGGSFARFQLGRQTNSLKNMRLFVKPISFGYQIPNNLASTGHAMAPQILVAANFTFPDSQTTNQ